MKIHIDYQTIEYIPDFNPFRPSDNGWKKQNQDSFKIIDLGGKKVFVKRMDKNPNDISGFGFLMNAKGRNFENLPKIYDIVFQNENGHKVYYLFQEALEGDTMENILNRGSLTFDIQIMGTQIFKAIQTISNYGYWYTDFIEKNIFIADTGDFYLIDLDSVANKSILPMDDNHLISSVNKDYTIAVCSYWYRDYFGYPFDFIKNNLKGDTLNFLQLLIYIGQIKYFIQNKQLTDFFAPNVRKELPEFLTTTYYNPVNNLFRDSFSYPDKAQRVIELEEFANFLNTLFPDKSMIELNVRRLQRQISNNPTTTSSQTISQTSMSNKKNKEESKTFLKSIISFILIGTLFFTTFYFWQENSKLQERKRILSSQLQTSEESVKNVENELTSTKAALNEVKKTLINNNKYFLITKVEITNGSVYKDQFLQSEIRYATPKLFIYSFLDKDVSVEIRYNKQRPDGLLSTFGDENSNYIKENFTLEPGANEIKFPSGWGEETWQLGTYTYVFYLNNSFQDYTKYINIE